MKEHVMKGKKARGSYVRLLLYVQRLLKEDAAKYDTGNDFL